MKTITITIDNDGKVVVSPVLTEEEQLQIAEELFGWDLQTDNQGQYMFYTGIYDTEHEGYDPGDDEDSPDSLRF